MTIRVIAAVLFPAIMLAAGGQGAAKKAAKPAQTKAAAAKPTVPAGAEKVDSGTWRYKDPAGKVWIYRQTPFGLVHFEEQPETEEPLPPGMKAVEDGDNVRFERPTPFGNVKWVRAKSELNDLERRVFERDCSKKPGETGEATSSEAGKQAGK